MLHLDATSGLLVGALQPPEQPDSIALIGAVGSYTVGATGHVNLGSGFSLDGGAALFGQDTLDASASGVLINGRLSFLSPETGTFRPYAAAGLRAAPGMNLTFTRSYDDGSPDGATATSSGSGSLYGAYAEGGLLFAPDADNTVLFTATLAHDWLDTEASRETFSEDNIFAASIAHGTAGFSTVKAGAAWTTRLDQHLDLTLSGAVGHVFAEDTLATEVAFVGSVTGGAADESFAQYGARLGWQVDPQMRADVFALGSTGAVSGTHLQVGGGLRLQF